MKSLVRWDPLRLIRGFDPLEELRTMQREMDRLFERVLSGESRTAEEQTLWLPSVESYVKEGNVFIKAELPGVDAKDLDVTVTERELVIKGERKTEKDEKNKDYSYREISYGSFERHLTLPEGAHTEQLKATFTNGVLEISVPVPALPKAKKISIETKEARQIEAEPKAKKAA
jgi:HSP20 family protein